MKSETLVHRVHGATVLGHGGAGALVRGVQASLWTGVALALAGAVAALVRE